MCDILRGVVMCVGYRAGGGSTEYRPGLQTVVSLDIRRPISGCNHGNHPASTSTIIPRALTCNHSDVILQMKHRIRNSTILVIVCI